MKEQIEAIEQTHELHDSLLSAMQFDFEQQSLTIAFEFWDSFKNDYTVFKMIFGGLNKFLSEFPENEDFKPKECSSWRWEETEPGRFEAVFTFLNAENMIGWYVTIGFTSLETEGGLSKEARADKAAYLQESGD